MTDRERFLACILGEPVDRPPFWLYWGPWQTTVDRWKTEGMPEGADHRSLFDSDQPPMIVPVNLGPCPPVPEKVFEETDEFIVHSGDWGVITRDLKDRSSMPEFLEFPIKTPEDWQQFKDERFDPNHPDRLKGEWRRICTDYVARGCPIQLGCFPDVGVFGSVRWLLGDEECLMAFYTMPDLVHDIMGHMTSVYLTVFDAVVRQVRVDVIHIWEDMCGRQGPLISPDHWEQFLGPQYRRIAAFAAKHDIRVISVDTDGNPDLIIPPMLKAGVNFLYPFEVAAGCDVNVLGDRYPALGMMGGIDKRALAEGPAAIDNELERVRPAVEKGHYIPTTDHLIPHDVSWDNYCYYANALKKLIGKT